MTASTRGRGLFFFEPRPLSTYDSCRSQHLDLLNSSYSAWASDPACSSHTRIHHLQLDGVIPGWELARTGNWQVRTTKRNLGSYVSAVN